MYNSLKRGKLNEGFQKKLRRMVSKHTSSETKRKADYGSINRLLKASDNSKFHPSKTIGHAANLTRASVAKRSEGRGNKKFKKSLSGELDYNKQLSKSHGLVNKDSIQYERGVIEGLGTKIIGGVLKRVVTWPLAAAGGLYHGVKGAKAAFNSAKDEEPITKPKKGTIKPKKGKMVQKTSVPAEPEE